MGTLRFIRSQKVSRRIHSSWALPNANTGINTCRYKVYLISNSQYATRANPTLYYHCSIKLSHKILFDKDVKDHLQLFCNINIPFHLSLHNQELSWESLFPDISWSLGWWWRMCSRWSAGQVGTCRSMPLPGVCPESYYNPPCTRQIVHLRGYETWQHPEHVLHNTPLFLVHHQPIT